MLIIYNTNLSGKRYIYSFPVFFISIDHQLFSVLSQVGQKAAQTHVGHDYVGSVFLVNTNSYQLHHIWMVQVDHEKTFFNQSFEITTTEETYELKGCSSHFICTLFIQALPFNVLTATCSTSPHLHPLSTALYTIPNSPVIGSVHYTRSL